MTELAERLKERYFRSEEHPYRLLEREVDRHLQPEHTLLDAGCGRTARLLLKHRGRARRLIGVDLVINRVLRHGGYFIFLTANLWDYAALIAKLVPNRFHPWIVSKTEGRKEQDVFPIQYQTNTFRAVKKWASQADFEIVSFRYLGQDPSYFTFNAFLFLLATAYEKVLSKFDALRFLRGWIFVTLRKK